MDERLELDVPDEELDDELVGLPELFEELDFDEPLDPDARDELDRLLLDVRGMLELDRPLPPLGAEDDDELPTLGVLLELPYGVHVLLLELPGGRYVLLLDDAGGTKGGAGAHGGAHGLAHGAQPGA